MRKKKMLLNSSTALIKQLITIICGFILPRYILMYFGSEVNGLITSIAQFLGFISFLEMGIGPVIQSNLYKPLAEKNKEEISKIVVSAERFFRKLAVIFIIYLFPLVLFFPTLIQNNFGFVYTASLILIISISTFAQYFFGITYQLLLNADQKGYVQISLQTVTIALNTVASVFLMKMGASIHIIKLATATIYLARPLGQVIYVHRKYNINHKIKFEGEPIKQKWNGFSQHLAAVVVENTDVPVLSIFSSLQNVSIYSVYYTVVSSIYNTVMTLATGLESLWGNMLARKEIEKLRELFEVVEWLIHMGCTWMFSVTGILIVPFVQVYTDGILDINYNFPVFGAILVMAYGLRGIRLPYFDLISAAGMYKETQNGSFIQMAINLSVSVLLVFKFGLSGVAMGTLAAMLYHTTYFAWFLRNHILNRPFRIYLRYLSADVVIATVCAVISSRIGLGAISYLAWAAMAVKVSVLCAVICLVMNFVMYRQMFGKLVRLVCKR